MSEPAAVREGRPAGPAPVDFGEFVRREGGNGRLVVQPRMGFGDPGRMRTGLVATKAADAATVGTLTLDSYTRVGNLEAVETALRDGIDLNGYPVVSHPPATTAAVLGGVRDAGFPVQVRHGSATPIDIFRAMMRLDLNATEGGPVSYCLPYGRTPLADAIRNWEDCCDLYVRMQDVGIEPHLETFGGCMMGQLCPPSQLVAISFLEAMFFAQHGLRSVSMSYAQQTDPVQDREAVTALRRLSAELLPIDNWHVVIYAYMGVYPETDHGAYGLLGSAAELAVSTGAERLIVKTAAEAAASRPSRRTSRPSNTPAGPRCAPAADPTTSSSTPRPTRRRAPWWTPSSTSTTTSGAPCSRRSGTATSTSRTACTRTTPAARAATSTPAAASPGPTPASSRWPGSPSAGRRGRSARPT